MRTRRFEYSFTAPLSAAAIEFLEIETRVAFHHLDTAHWLCVTAWNETGSVVGVLTCEPRNWFDWHLSCAIADQQLMNRRLLKTIFKTVFSRARRVTALVEPWNERALKQMTRMGFVYEGYLRCGIEGERDAYLFGMLAADCRYLPGYRGTGTVMPPDISGVTNGQLSQSA